MNSKYAESKLMYLDLLFNYFKEQSLNEELNGHIAKYLTVLISGYYQDIIKRFILELAQKENMNSKIKNFVLNQIDFSLKNPLYCNIQTFLNRFDKNWIKILSKEITSLNVDALNSIVNNKNNISHGDPSYITFEQIKENYENSKIIIFKLDVIILD